MRPSTPTRDEGRVAMTVVRMKKDEYSELTSRRGEIIGDYERVKDKPDFVEFKYEEPHTTTTLPYKVSYVNHPTVAMNVDQLA